MSDSIVNPETTTPPDLTQVADFRESYNALLTEINKVPESDLVHITIDVATAATTALGKLSDIRALRSHIVDEMPRFDIVTFDKLEKYAQAASYAHALWCTALAPAGSLEQLTVDGNAMRESLLTAATALANKRLIDGHKLDGLVGNNGARNLAVDLFSLASIFRDSWVTVGSKTAVQVEELAKADALGSQLLTAVGLRDQGPAIVAAAAETRSRAFALFVRAYDRVRRAATYLRWDEGDVDQIAPSLYAGRGGRRKSTDIPEPVAPGAGLTATGTPASAVAPVAGAPVAGAPVNGSPANGATPAAVHPAAGATGGLPVSTPFSRA